MVMITEVAAGKRRAVQPNSTQETLCCSENVMLPLPFLSDSHDFEGCFSRKHKPRYISGFVKVINLFTTVFLLLQRTSPTNTRPQEYSLKYTLQRYTTPIFFQSQLFYFLFCFKWKSAQRSTNIHTLSHTCTHPSGAKEDHSPTYHCLTVGFLTKMRGM